MPAACLLTCVLLLPLPRSVGFFAGLGFAIPPRKGVADFLQEVTSRRDQQVRREGGDMQGCGLLFVHCSCRRPSLLVRLLLGGFVSQRTQTTHATDTCKISYNHPVKFPCRSRRLTLSALCCLLLQQYWARDPSQYSFVPVAAFHAAYEASPQGSAMRAAVAAPAPQQPPRLDPLVRHR